MCRIRLSLVSTSLMSQTKCGHLKDYCWRGLKEFAGDGQCHAEYREFYAACHWVAFFHSFAIKDVDHLTR